ncbi:restriction endonuclease subunit S [Pseudoalteromonas sp. SG45-5]|uniref:restriction endonuclease subunit S n=1 Tax=unclassified Pseudoalteromonas TaxID=194690 RepID=UPI0015FD8479|nr:MULTISPECIES: restriction endonuclease subunit S [unclassified Pseudoalteromonas]MBB1387474.1 restriction endonuclease subunit S [Pseudoalteromonas sp. SG45-5]MBB1395672.1 restriction endonuclease subunit S [Pseudoalteromonas sp. SG44-4]MBB1448175.1 restriction endonuclease subunit S [Pseudoalteromonas sp. SG41-6]
MGSNLLLTSISDIALEMGDAPFGSNLKNSDYTDDGVLVVQGRNVTGRTFTWSNNRYVSLEKYNSIPRSHCFVGDLIFPKVGTIGKVGRLSACEGYDKYILSTNTMRLRVDPKKANPLFVYYYFTWTKTVNLIQAMNSKSVQPVFNFTTLKKFPIGLPPRRSQDFSAKILDSIDNKIELNQKNNQTLEKMAQALFKSWFVDFDPVFDNLLASIDFNLDNLETSLPDELIQKAQRRLAALNSLHNAAECKASLSALAHELQAQRPAKEVTKDATQAAVQVSEKTAETPVKANLNANPNILAQHANTHAHFPNEFEHNEQLGWIPKGWGVDKAEKVADIAIGKTPPRKQKEWFSDNPINNKVWVSIKDMGGNKTFIGDSSEYLTSESVSKFNVKVVPKDSVILSFKLTLGRVCITKCDLTTNEAIAHFVNPKHSMSKEYVYLYLKCFDYGSLGSTSSIATAVNSKIIKAMPFLVPNKTVLSSFKGSVENIFFKMDTLGSETTSLTKLRDTLLPKLISGELQIPDVATDDETVD